MGQIGLTIWNMEEIMQKTMTLVGQGQNMETIGLTLRQLNWALIMALLTHSSMLRSETILPLQVDRHF